jgi:hypothetical protein
MRIIVENIPILEAANLPQAHQRSNGWVELFVVTIGATFDKSVPICGKC